MEYFILGSGSKGNATVIHDQNTWLLFDCGFNKASLHKRLEAFHIDFNNLNAAFFTHHHSDHIAGIDQCKNLSIFAPFEINAKHFTLVEPYQSYFINQFKITSIKLSHDADEIVGYIIDDNKEKLVLVTDTGYLSEKNFMMIQNADYYIFEANHDVEMLMRTNRPSFLKARIISDIGHMNNEDAGIALAGVIGNKTKEIILAHLSQEANEPSLALETVRRIITSSGIPLDNIRLDVALQDVGIFGGHQ